MGITKRKPDFAGKYNWYISVFY